MLGFIFSHPPNSNLSDVAAETSVENQLLAISCRAVVTRAILPERPGRIHFRATDWFAESLTNDPICPGTSVELVQREGNTWLVVPASKSSLN